jgi:hypothetical protein
MTDNLTRDEVRALIGRANDNVVSEILNLGANRAELAEAGLWLENDEAMLNEGRSIPSGRVGRLIEILQVCDDDLPVGPRL